MKTSSAPSPLHALAVLALAASLVLAGCGGGSAPDAQAADASGAKAGETGKDEAPAVPVEVARVTRRPISASYTGTANLEAPAEAQVVAKTSGVVLQILAEEGDVVRAGQVLARIDPEKPRLEMERARATVRKLENNYRRAQELLASRLVSAESVEQIRFDLESARASYELARLELSYTDIVAPFDGVVAQRMVKAGNLVPLNAPVFRIVDNTRLEAVLNVPEREMATLKPGLPLRMRVDAIPGRIFDGRVDRVSPVVDAGSGTFRVVAAFAGGDTLRPGMFGRIEVVYDERDDALTMPRVALLENEGEPAVFVVREEKAVRVPVQLGYVNGEFAEVRAGLSEGDAVVTAGKVAIRDGSTVEVINADGAAESDGGAQAVAQAY
ncbi:efflux RND transporter periplasmic adaptor subunit [Arenimonas fontis]|uniref:Efflux RND transporter periplasmic adaptor subunit n=1 Tax=Arenimonas fontis TaxID=2608255 RepID=A0A5B2ZFK2_9GAMM|nr:efflux RND transporter periplasmic adaptor subunit [Arenimonas fontis]KAA2286010.1 efflux RND transporter periplasmic adaptor subunit [Arenimonas fontis]